MSMAEQIKYKNPMGPAGAAEQVCGHWKTPTVESADIILGEEEALTDEEDLDHLGQGMKTADDPTSHKNVSALQVLIVWSMHLLVQVLHVEHESEVGYAVDLVRHPVIVQVQAVILETNQKSTQPKHAEQRQRLNKSSKHRMCH